MIKDIQEKILKLKEEKDICILAHSYQAREIVEIADYVGDSFQLSRMAQGAENKNILFCGVHFMAETAKMLSPDKRVYIANPCAGCPMAEQMSPEMIEKIKAEAEKILFIPDCNLGTFVQNEVPEKDIKLLQGGCPVHSSVTLEELEEVKAQHPDALVLVHPECIPAVAEKADYVGSTSGIMDFAEKSDAKEFIIGTEISIAEHLQYELPEKKFYVLSKKIICGDMRLTTLMDVLNSCEGIDNDGASEIIMTDEEIASARVCIDEMLRLG